MGSPAGVAGAWICQHFLDRRWVVRIGSSRAVRATPVGAAALQDLLGLDPPYRPDPRDQGSGMAVYVTIPLP